MKTARQFGFRHQFDRRISDEAVADLVGQQDVVVSFAGVDLVGRIVTAERCEPLWPASVLESPSDGDWVWITVEIES